MGLIRFFLAVLGAFAFLNGNLRAWAWPPLFGPEFTFTNERLYRAN